MFRLSLAFSLFLLCSEIAARPLHQARKGFGSCMSCHVSPSGGGILNGYGKSISESISTWAFEGSGRTDYGLTGEHDYLDYVDIGGNFRSIFLKNEYAYSYIPMQRDIEVALHPNEFLSLVYSRGVYGRTKVSESRRYYALFRIDRSLSFRLGRFNPAFGLGIPDHTASVRRGIGMDQGSESLNAELSYRNKHTEIFLTYVEGKDVTLNSSRERNVLSSEDKSELYLKASWFASRHSGLGVQYRYSNHFDEKDHLSGIYGWFSWNKRLTIMSEVNYQIDNDIEYMQRYITYTKCDYMIIDGLHLNYGYELLRDINYYFAGLQFFPFPHLEIDGQIKYDEESTTYLLLLGYYL